MPVSPVILPPIRRLRNLLDVGKPIPSSGFLKTDGTDHIFSDVLVADVVGLVGFLADKATVSDFTDHVADQNAHGGLGTAARLNTGSTSGTIAVLESGGKLNAAVLPSIAVTDTFVVGDEISMLALTADVGDVAVRTDLNKSFILKTAGAGTLGNWQELLTPTDAVGSVNGLSGVVVLSTTNIAEGTNQYWTAGRIAPYAPLAGAAFTGDVVLRSDADLHGASLVLLQMGADPGNFYGGGPLQLYWDYLNSSLRFVTSVNEFVNFECDGLSAGVIAASGDVSGSNLSGTNTGDQDLAGYALLSGADFSGAVTVGSTLYVNGDQQSGTNTGDQDLSAYALLSGADFTGTVTVNGDPQSGVNTGDQDLSAYASSSVTLQGSGDVLIDGDNATHNLTTYRTIALSGNIPQKNAANVYTVNGIASTPMAKLNGTWYSGGTATTTKPAFLVEPTGTTSTGWVTTGTGIGVNAPAGFTGRLLDLQLAGGSKAFVGYNSAFTFNKFIYDGNVALTLGSGNGTFAMTGNYAGSGDLTSGGLIYVNSGSVSIVPAADTGSAGHKVIIAYFDQTGWKSAAEVANSATTNGGTLALMKNGGLVSFGDVTNLVFNTNVGSKIGTSTAQKLGFWNAAPIVQPASANQAIATDAASVIVLANALRLALVNAGLIKGSA